MWEGTFLTSSNSHFLLKKYYNQGVLLGYECIFVVAVVVIVAIYRKKFDSSQYLFTLLIEEFSKGVAPLPSVNYVNFEDFGADKYPKFLCVLLRTFSSSMAKSDVIYLFYCAHHNKKSFEVTRFLKNRYL